MALTAAAGCSSWSLAAVSAGHWSRFCRTVYSIPDLPGTENHGTRTRDRRTWTQLLLLRGGGCVLRALNPTDRSRDAFSSATAYPLNEASLHQNASPHNKRILSQFFLLGDLYHQYTHTRVRVAHRGVYVACISSLSRSRASPRIPRFDGTPLKQRNDLLTTLLRAPISPIPTEGARRHKRTALTPTTVTFR